MRPIKLSMTAFGPFVDTQTIDFEALGEKPLFLINGATGSGKTTILDGICFALYGQTTGKEREAGQMRCDYADDKKLTAVEFEFELADTCYRIKRIPEQQRAKAKGEGTTRQAAEAQLYRLDGDDEILLVARKVSDATKEIENLTGLQVDQFRQVMVLPQGQFRRLLMADSKDRESIFSQLFETHIYKRIEDKLKAQAKKVYIEVAKLRDNQQGVLDSAGVESVDQLMQMINTLKPECKQAAQQAEAHDKQYVALLKGFEKATALATEFDQLQKQQHQLELLEQQKEAIQGNKDQLSKAELALKISPCYNDLTRLRTSLSNLAEKEKQADSALKSAQSHLAKANTAIDENTNRRKQLDKEKQTLATLTGYRERALALQKAVDDFNTSQNALVAEDSKLVDAQQQLDSTIKQLEETEKQIEQLETDLSSASDITLAHQKTTELLKQKEALGTLSTKRDALEKKLAVVVEEGKKLNTQNQHKQKESKQLELLWYKGQAAILARELAQDEACPVCGSKDHPAPAQADQELPSDQQRETAQKEAEQLQQRYQAKQDEYTRVHTELKSYSQQVATAEDSLGEEAVKQPIEAIRQQQQGLLEQLNKSKQQQQQLAQLKSDRTAIKQSYTTLSQAVEAIKNSRASVHAKVESHKALVTKSEQELPEAYRASGKLEQSITHAENAISTLEKAIDDIQQQHNEASNEVARASTTHENVKKSLVEEQTSVDKAIIQWQETLEKSPFDDEQSYQQALLNEAQINSLKSNIQAYESSYQQAKGVLKTLLKSLKNKTMPDLSVLKTEVDTSLQEKQKADDVLKQLEIQLSGLSKAAKTLQSYATKLEEKEKTYRVIGTLSDVANGVTGNKISLQRFVLGVLLDDVLIEASHRLKLMSKGRYLLLRKENRAKGNKASGLELEVEDSYTGKVRAVSTLSGGESFIASLSLALGLSDVVQAYAGGIRLDTLFIDEGFGSLDADSLDLAIRTLIDLRNTGRMVGIISHVSELKEQIKLRLDVKSSRYGSHVELVN